MSKDALEVSLVVEIPLTALEVSDDEPAGIKMVENPNVACPEDELIAIGDWESEQVDDAAGIPEDGLGDDTSFCTRRTERVKGVVAEFPWYTTSSMCEPEESWWV